MGNCTQALELIRQVCRTRQLDEDDTFRITRKLLENYRSALWIHKGITGTAKTIIGGDGKRQVKQWYLSFKQITKEEQKEAAIDSAIFHVCRTDWIIKAVEMVMEKVNAFRPYGDLYHDILQLAYVVEEKLTDCEIAEKLGIERSTYYRRKKEAIFLSGILLWDEAREKCFAQTSLAMEHIIDTSLTLH
ncbi:MAG: hypothetical protein K6G22_02055 [Lachnospiraceae bacterium]|nr:hypothetical protein [Lachnospiraceae bacterium]